MDPNETLAWLREQLSHVNNLTNIDEVAERFNALDEWFKRGGWWPNDWLPAVAYQTGEAYADGYRDGQKDA